MATQRLFGSTREDPSFAGWSETVLPLPAGDEARLIFVTHLARESDLRATIHEVRDLDVVERVGSVLRVVGGEE